MAASKSEEPEMRTHIQRHFFSPAEASERNNGIQQREENAQVVKKHIFAEALNSSKKDEL